MKIKKIYKHKIKTELIKSMKSTETQKGPKTVQSFILRTQDWDRN